MILKRLLAVSTVLALAIVFCLSSTSFAGNKKMMTINAAKVVAERGIIESIYGLKVRASESVTDMMAAGFTGSAETKTEAQIKGIKFDDIVYDAKKDVAKITASVSLPNITNINGEVIDLKGKVFRRVGFATSTPGSAGPLMALRAAEVDAYKQLAKQLVGFTLQSQTKVENFILTSDVIKTKVMATLFLAEVTSYGWSDDGDAFVKMSLSLADFADVVGQGVVGEAAVITVEGLGAQKNDFVEPKKNAAAKKNKKAP